MERSARGDLDYDIDILGRPRSWRRRIGDPEHDAGAAEEHDIAKHRLQRLGGTLEKLNTHAAAVEPRRARNSSSAMPRTRASPIRSPSVSVKSSVSAGSRREISGAAP